MPVNTVPDTLPHSDEAERSVIGAVLVDNQQFHKVQEIVTHEAFYSGRHRKIFLALERLIEQGSPLDLVTLRADLDRSGDLEGCGGPAYLASLVDGASRSTNVEHYARIVKEKATLRDLIHASQWIQSAVTSPHSSTDDLIDEAEKKIFSVAEGRLRKGFIHIRESADLSLEHIETLSERQELITGVPTDFPQLDEITAGLQPSDLIVLAARPSMGKTALALNLAVNASRGHGHSVGIFSLEMSHQQLFQRMLCSEARVDAHRLRTGRIDEGDWQKIVKSYKELSECKIFIDDTPGVSLLDVRAKARRLQHERGLDMLVIDYMQLMRGSRNRYESRQQEISDISRSLKELSKELTIPIVALSQLSRAPEQRTGDRRPQLSDLRESGAIEQDADVVMFLFREEVYKKEDPELRGRAELIIGKQRNGPTGVIDLVFIREFTRFENPEWREI